MGKSKKFWRTLYVQVSLLLNPEEKVIRKKKKKKTDVEMLKEQGLFPTLSDSGFSQPCSTFNGFDTKAMDTTSCCNIKPDKSKGGNYRWRSD